MHAKVHLLIGRSCCLPRCNSLDDKIKLNGMHRSIVQHHEVYSVSWSVMLTFVLVPT